MDYKTGKRENSSERCDYEMFAKNLILSKTENQMHFWLALIFPE